MKRIVFVLCVLSLFVVSAPLLQASENEARTKAKGASQAAYEHASDNSVFNRVSDWFATVGKTDEEKAVILAERKAKRAVARAQKEAEKAQKKAQKEAGKLKKGVEKKGSGKKDDLFKKGS